MVSRYSIAALAPLVLAGSIALAASPKKAATDTEAGMGKAPAAEAPADQATTPKKKSRKHARSHHHSRHAAKKTSARAAS